MAVKIIWSPEALDHLTAIRDYIAEDSPKASARTAQSILDCVALPAAQPGVGRPGRLLGTRELVVAGTNYIIPYRLRRGRLELLAVFHGRQKWPSSL